MKSRTTTLDPRAASKRLVQALMAGMVVAVLAATGLPAHAQPAPPPPPPAMDMGGPGMRHGMHHGGGMGGGMMFGGSPERAARMIDSMLDGLNASDAQRNQIKQIAAAAAADMKAQMQAGRGLRQRGMEIFAAPTVDAAAAEQLRQQMLQQHDQMSRRMTQAMVDVARVLTPEQRAKIGERLKDRRARMEERLKRMDRPQPPR